MASYNDIYEVIMEKKSREKYRIDKFKKEHDFIPDYSKNKFGRIGTMLVDGKRVSADLDIHDRLAEPNENTIIPRQTAALIGKVPEGLVFDKAFFNLKNKNRMNALLNHEIGHLKMHSTQPDAKARSSKFVTGANLNQSVENTMATLINMGVLKPSDKREFKKEMIKELDTKGYLKTGTRDKNERHIREMAWKTAQKYSRARNAHLNPQEFEADRYAANKSGESALKRGLREYGKHIRKSNQKMAQQALSSNSVDKVKQMLRERNVSVADDYNVRMKALKDPEIRDNKLYK